MTTGKPPRYASWTHGKLPLPELAEMKRRGEKIVMVTAYDAPSGRLADAAGVDLILVGDSSGMVMHGRESTVPVTLGCRSSTTRCGATGSAWDGGWRRLSLALGLRGVPLPGRDSLPAWRRTRDGRASRRSRWESCRSCPGGA